MSSAAAPVRWAVLGPGSIARRFASELPYSEAGVLVAVGSTSPDRARSFAEEFAPAAPAVVGTYDEVLACPEVDAVYVATVHTTHAPLAAAALEAGKHVLCEKPMTPNAATTMALADLATRSGLALLEAYMYRFHPQTVKVLELVRDGAIGEVLHIDASFAFDTGREEGRLFDPATAGGGILDVGGYPLSLARFVVGATQGTAYADPTDVRGAGTVGATGVDLAAAAHLSFAGGITAALRTGIRLDDPQSATITGSRGVIRLADPWALGDQQVIELAAVGEGLARIEVPAARSYALEADALARAAATGTEVPEIDLANSLGQARAQDSWRRAVGVTYPFEKDDAEIPTLSGRPLVMGAGARSAVVDGRTAGTEGTPAMPYGRIPGIDKPVSRLVMGCDNQSELPHASAMFDAFLEAGGTTFDTAYVYGGGRPEALLGAWMRNRGVRDDVVLIAKGAHTPHCDPESIIRQLTESLERLGTDHADIYMMHRDNLQVPVGEFVDVLDELAGAGRITAFGGSNWTPERVDEAQEYARRTGRREFSVLSNHFGLARALDVPWAGCVHSTDPDSRQWLEQRKIALLPWSSQARGFFTGRAHPQDTSDPELVRCYYSEENFQRLERARVIAEEQQVPPTAVALAYVLHQRFETYALFGPRTLAEMRSSMRGLGVSLSERDVQWLDLRTETR